MSRVAKVPVALAKGVEAQVSDAQVVIKGRWARWRGRHPPLVRITVCDGRVSFARPMKPRRPAR